MRPRLKTSPSTVAIKRVLRQGGRYTCGVCRKAYALEAEAEGCLPACLHAHVNPASAVAAVAGSKMFRCHYCKRAYGERASAQTCADACRRATQKAVADASALKSEEGVRASAPAKAAAKAPAPARTLAKPVPAKPAPAPPSAPRAQPAPAAKATPPEATTAAPPVGDAHKFIRDGARYVCRGCKQKFFTRDDVCKCFDSHAAA
jgi:hypothetical protein